MSGRFLGACRLEVVLHGGKISGLGFILSLKCQGWNNHDPFTFNVRSNTKDLHESPLCRIVSESFCNLHRIVSPELEAVERDCAVLKGALLCLFNIWKHQYKCQVAEEFNQVRTVQVSELGNAPHKVKQSVHSAAQHLHELTKQSETGVTWADWSPLWLIKEKQCSHAAELSAAGKMTWQKLLC